MEKGDKDKDPLIGKVFFKLFKVKKAIGEGSFGKIYQAVSEKNGEEFAIKLEKRDSGKNLLETEAYILCHVKAFGVPQVKSFGYNSTYNILIMELMGSSLEDLFQKMHKKFSIKTAVMLGIQMVERIEWVHSRFIMHRDIKPDNFVMGRNKKAPFVHVLDFGLAKKYWSSRRKAHIPYVTNKKLTGTARYASINALKGCEQSRRDDLESIGYVIMYFLRGSLPWQGLKVNTKEDRYQKIYEKKKATTCEELCHGFPKELEEYVRYTRNLQFTDAPNYNYLYGLFKSVLKNIGAEMDYYYDWCKEKPVIKKEFMEISKGGSSTMVSKNEDEKVNNEKEKNDSHIKIDSKIDSNSKIVHTETNSADKN